MMSGMVDPTDPEPRPDRRGRRVLVTGGAGVIARELLDRLADRGATVLSVDRLPLGRPTPAGVEHLVADLADTDLGEIVDFAPQTIFHLAATFERSIESPEFWEPNWSDNVVVTHRLAELAARVGSVEAFVFASSYLTYRTSQYLFPEPLADGIALAEDGAVLPRNLCGAAKLYGEAELAFARDVLGGGFRAVSARIFRVYGRGSRDVVSRWIRAALRDEAIEVYHPENRFDYVYSGDVAEGLLRMASGPRAEGVLNLGTGRARAVSDVMAAIETATGRRLNARVLQIDEPYEASRADISRLRSRLGWQPDTSLEAGVASLVAHERAGATVEPEPADAAF
jgi:carbamoyl-phosphate synthase large subunit